MAENDAAIKIQALLRGRVARLKIKSDMQKMQKEQQAAAVKIQSLQRGRIARRQFAEKKAEQERARIQLQKQNQAAAHIQALLRGRIDRAEYAKVIQMQSFFV